MIISKLKYVISIVLVISILLIITPSFSETKPEFVKSELTEIGANIFVIKEEVNLIGVKLGTIESEGRVRTHLQHDELLDAIESVNRNLSEIVTLLDHEAESIIVIPHIMEKYRSFFAKLRIEKINLAKELIKISLRYLNYIYGESEFKATLWAVGDPRKKIEEALKLLDKSIVILQGIKDKESNPK